MLDNMQSKFNDPLERLEHTIALLKKYRVDIEKALCYTEGAWDFNQVCASVLSGRVDTYETPNSLLLCQINSNPSTNVYHVFIAVGTLEEILHFAQTQLITEARLRNCTALSFEGRRGWTKHLSSMGWGTEQVVMYKRIQ